MSWVIDDSHELIYNPDVQHLVDTPLNPYNIYLWELSDNSTPSPIIKCDKDFIEFYFENETCRIHVSDINHIAGIHEDMSSCRFNEYPNTYILYLDDDSIAHLVTNKIVNEGAFREAKLTSVSIPKSCKKIGPNTFKNTLLTSVTIAKDCVYDSTSFPPGCEISYYEDT